MTCLTRFSCALAFCLSVSIPSWGQSAPVVYVATGDSNVYAVSTNGAANTALISNDSAYSGDTFTSLTVGPDNTSANTSGNNYFFLFACDSPAKASCRFFSVFDIVVALLRYVFVAVL